MTDAGQILERNAASTARLETLVDGLSESDLRRSLGGGWTIAVALTHLAFWDFRQVGALEHFVQTGVLPDEDDTVNPALEATAKGMDPRKAARLAVKAANTVDGAVAGLGPDAFARLASGEAAYPVERFAHRDEHIAQIEAGLG